MKTRVSKDHVARGWRLALRKFLREIALRGGVRMATCALRALRHTWHVERVDKERFFLTPVIVAFWHGDLLIGAAEALWSRRRDFATLTSRSRDGEVAATLARQVGVTPLRGGASRGQVEALRAMERWLSQKGSLVVAVDGPRGPRGVVKSGVILLASRSGVPIVPAAAIVPEGQSWRFRSWDKMCLPKPGCRFQVVFGEPIRVPSKLSRDELESFRILLERELFCLHKEPQVANDKPRENENCVEVQPRFHA
ncbi:MAG: lysophospholipid acyltransferase family protein [Candidatus Sumerlaeaceae bacterium]|jgi:lysophospholipid acyltransferase (LPLAT)-like uncharacterized protein